MAFPPTTIVCPIQDSFSGTLDGNGFFLFPLVKRSANYLINGSMSFGSVMENSSVGVIVNIGSSSIGIFYIGELNATGFQCSQSLAAGDILEIQVLTTDDSDAQ